MNNVKTESEQLKRPEPVALVDCGQASKVTKGLALLWFFELSPPPFDTTLIM